MARHSSENEPDADEVDETAESDAKAEPDETVESEETGSDEAEQPERTAEADTFWSDVRIDPIEVALPAGVGYTLRAYRDPDDVSAVAGDEPADDEEAGDDTAMPESDSEAPDDDEAPADEDDESDEDEPDEDEGEEDDEEEEEDEGPDEVPVFLSARGKLLLFRSAEGLAAFLRSDEPHALRGIDTYETLAQRIDAGYLVPSDEDRYELDLVVSNLRGGHDAWEPELVIKAGELARDLGYSLKLQTVLTSLAPGSPLDDLDDALRAAAGGGIGGFRGRRRMRKIGAQQAALAWRTIIGKIGAAVDWRD